MCVCLHTVNWDRAYITTNFYIKSNFKICNNYIIFIINNISLLFINTLKMPPPNYATRGGPPRPPPPSPLPFATPLNL